jgi:hypothetical protein
LPVRGVSGYETAVAIVGILFFGVGGLFLTRDALKGRPNPVRLQRPWRMDRRRSSSRCHDALMLLIVLFLDAQVLIEVRKRVALDRRPGAKAA